MAKKENLEQLALDIIMHCKHDSGFNWDNNEGIDTPDVIFVLKKVLDLKDLSIRQEGKFIHLIESLDIQLDGEQFQTLTEKKEYAILVRHMQKFLTEGTMDNIEDIVCCLDFYASAIENGITTHDICTLKWNIKGDFKESFTKNLEHFKKTVSRVQPSLDDAGSGLIRTFAFFLQSVFPTEEFLVIEDYISRIYYEEI